MTPFENSVPLAPLTTLGLGGNAERFLRLERKEDLPEVLNEARAPVRILGGGSNLVVADQGVSGTVVQMATRGLSLERKADLVWLTAEAGEPWQSLVDLALEEDLAGVECLTGIPGSVGATPIQNVGAYGQEVADTLCEVQVLERATGRVGWLSAADCGFAYRDSAFKRQPDRYVVLAVRFALTPGGAPCLRYAELVRALEVRGAATPSLRQVADTVWALRAAKSMVVRAGDPNRHSAGSFFTNPIVSSEVAADAIARALDEGLVERADQVPQFPTGPGHVKLAAGWLIERAGFAKGLRAGHVGISTQHALALVHHGGGSTAELLELARTIRDGVQARFGIALGMEPICWDTAL